MDDYGEISRFTVETDINSIADRIMSIVVGMRLRMNTADLNLRGVLLEVEETGPGLIIVLWHIQFECLYLGEDDRCQNYQNRPQICKSYACDTVQPGNNRPSREALITENADLEAIDWNRTPNDQITIKTTLQERVRQIFDKYNI